MHLSLTILAGLGLTASAHSTTEKRQPSKYEPCANSGFEWCDQGEMVTCHKGFVTGLQKRCASKRQADKAEICFNYDAKWCGDDGTYLTCKKVPLVDQGRVTSTGNRCRVTKRGVGSWCENIGATWCQNYKVLTCTNNRITHTGAGCDSQPHHRPGHGDEPGPGYNPEHPPPENNGTTTRQARSTTPEPEQHIPEWHHPNGTKPHGPPGPPARPEDGYQHGPPTPGKGQGHGPWGHGPQTNGTNEHGHHGPPEQEDGPPGYPTRPEDGYEQGPPTPGKGEGHVPEGYWPQTNGTNEHEHHGPPGQDDEHHGPPGNEDGYEHGWPTPDNNHGQESY